MISPNGQALSFCGEDALRYRQSAHWLQPPTRTASMVGRQSVTVAALPGRRRERGDEPTVSLAHQRHLLQHGRTSLERKMRYLMNIPLYYKDTKCIHSHFALFGSVDSLMDILVRRVIVLTKFLQLAHKCVFTSLSYKHKKTVI